MYAASPFPVFPIRGSAYPPRYMSRSPLRSFFDSPKVLFQLLQLFIVFIIAGKGQQMADKKEKTERWDALCSHGSILSSAILLRHPLQLHAGISAGGKLCPGIIGHILSAE